MSSFGSRNIPPAFTAHKAQILASLSIPDDEYTDLSPKGSIDKPIRDLIDSINNLDGTVTTSSCSGRVSVFIEGQKAISTTESGHDNVRSTNQKAVPGGKGFDGRWLFVSHDPLPLDSESYSTLMPQELLALLTQDISSSPSNIPRASTTPTRWIHLAFEPLILHICTASLAYAKPILALALDAGFRESGVQSLKCLDHAHAWPMVAIRSAGLSFSTIIGMLDEQGSECLLVDRQFLQSMLDTCNQRFSENQLRADRLRAGVKKLLDKQRDSSLMNGLTGENANGQTSVWEDKHVRAARKKAEGLRARDLQSRIQIQGSSPSEIQNDEEPLVFADELDT